MKVNGRMEGGKGEGETPPSPKKGCIMGRVMVGEGVRVNSVHYSAGFALQIVPACSRERRNVEIVVLLFFSLLLCLRVDG